MLEQGYRGPMRAVEKSLEVPEEELAQRVARLQKDLAALAAGSALLCDALDGYEARLTALEEKVP